MASKERRCGMSGKGSGRRPGTGYAEGLSRINENHGRTPYWLCTGSVNPAEHAACPFPGCHHFGTAEEHDAWEKEKHGA